MKQQPSVAIRYNVSRSAIEAYKKFDGDSTPSINYEIVDEFDVCGQMLHDFLRYLGILFLAFFSLLLAVYSSYVGILAETIQNPIATLLSSALASNTAPSTKSQCNLAQLNTCAGGAYSNSLEFVTVS